MENPPPPLLQEVPYTADGPDNSLLDFRLSRGSLLEHTAFGTASKEARPLLGRSITRGKPLGRNSGVVRDSERGTDAKNRF